MRLLLILPPMTQINTPYPSTAYLTAYLREKGFEVEQRDLGLDMILRLFSREGLARVRQAVIENDVDSEVLDFFLEAYQDYADTIDVVMRFLRGGDSSMALRIARRKLVPEGPRFIPLNEHSNLLEHFGTMGVQDQAKYIASLYLDDLADVFRIGVDPYFEFSRYGERLASSQNSFSPLEEALRAKKTLIDDVLEECLSSYLVGDAYDAVGFSVPFPGNVYGSFRAAAYLKHAQPDVVTIMGGGWVNTELRDMRDPRLFQWMDYLIFDDGERPLECLLEFLSGRRAETELLRTWFLREGKIVRVSSLSERDVNFKDLGAPTYDGLPLREYVPMLEMPNPMHRMWSDFRWNKMILAHGCYWKKCSFCDVSLDYIGRFESTKADTLLAHMKKLVDETGQTGFHFIDEAAPPALLRQLSQKIIADGFKANWWGNLRFDPQFTPELAELMSDAGCVAVTGGLEVASPRLLKLINKGVTIEQVARVTHGFSEAGIFVHAYLMYGFPSQTEQETVDSLEVVRQLFEAGCIQSAFWHRFVATVHSPVGKRPADFGIELVPFVEPADGMFAVNEVLFVDPVETEHSLLGEGLKKALYNYMHGILIDEDVRAWFDKDVPETRLPRDFIAKALASPATDI